MKELPVDIQSIEKILARRNCVYVDKTRFAYTLISGLTSSFFLARPRRFGKSLFLDTLAEIFKGNKALFKDCAIYQTDYDWKPYPVVAFDFANIDSVSPEKFQAVLDAVITRMAANYGIALKGPSVRFKLQVFVEELAKKYDKVVILVDEYDHPMVSRLHNPEVADANREILKDFFTSFKSLSKYLRFVFITGVSKFSQGSIFSGLNNLEDLTMDPEYAAILGYTEQELKYAFAEHIQGIAMEHGKDDQSVLSEIKEWYNGYRFSKEPTCVYNPFSTLKYMDEKEPKGYGYTTGTPTFLIHEIQKRPTITTSLAGVSVAQSQLTDARSIEDLDLPTLMFQTGYLTIRDYSYEESFSETFFELNFPNREVQKAFLNSLIMDFGKMNLREFDRVATQLREELTTLDLTAALKTLNIQFAKIPYEAFKEAKEGFYQAMMLICLEVAGLRTYGEVHTNLGRIDLVVQQPKHTFIFELKVDKPAAVALDQIQTKRYQERYLKDGKEIVAVAISFSTESRNIAAWKAGLYTPDGQLVQELAGIQA